MVDAQNERTNSQNRRRGRRRRRGRKPAEVETDHRVLHAPKESEYVDDQDSAPDPAPEPMITASEAPVIRPLDIPAPTIRSEEYCIHHMASFREHEPMVIRSNMTTLRHLQVDHFGEATLYCDCLHNGPHEWPPSMQKIETAIELDQFLADSTNDA